MSSNSPSRSCPTSAPGTATLTAERVQRILANLGPRVTSLELAEMLWLAQHLPEAEPEPEPGPEPRPEFVLDDDGAGAPRLAVPSEGRTSAVPAPQPPERRPLHHPSRGPVRGDSASSVQVPTAPALRDVLRIQRAMRPFKRRVPAPRARVLDETATASRIARSGPSGPWVPVLRPADQRWMRLALVVDSGPTMSVWHSLAREFSEAMVRLGAFRDVRTMSLVVRGEWVGVRTGRSGPVLPASSLADAGGRQILLILSDCSGPHWWSGVMAPAVERWARRGPTAVLQPLPERLWRRTAAPPVPGRAYASRAGASNDALAFRAHGARRADRAGPVPVPVLEVDPEWLADWSRLVTASRLGGVDAAVMYPRTAAELQPYALGTEQPISVAEQVHRFQRAASPSAADLAAHAAVTEPALPIMRLIQERLLPQSRPSDIAEVILSGLIRPVDSATGVFAFVPQARQALLETLPRAVAINTAQVLEEISAEIEARAGRGSEAFSALVHMMGGERRIESGARPFALISDQALRLIGTPMRPVAEQQLAAPVPAELPAEVPPPREAAPEVATTEVSVAAPERRNSIFRLRRRSADVACPYCYEQFDPSAIGFRCNGRISPTQQRCRRTRDVVLQERMGVRDEVGPPFFGPDGRGSKAVCPDCAGETTYRICPACHMTLPVQFGVVESRMIAMVGARMSGKSVYMTVLLHELRNQVGAAYGASLMSSDDNTLHRFLDGYQDRLYRDGQLLPGTQSAGATDNRVAPLVFRFALRRRVRFRERPMHTLLSFFDTAGEDLASSESVGVNSRYLAAADGIILMVDPLQLPGVNELNTVTDLLLAQNRTDSSGRIRIPVAVVVSKLDTLTQLLDRGSPLRAQPPMDGRFDVEDSRNVHQEVRQLLKKLEGTAIDRLMENTYSRFRYFGVSALGAAPAGARVAATGIQPYRVADPLLWLLSEFGSVPRTGRD
nr:SAV_2336 N-terminal domain-related protein [Streptomyces coryli]